MDTIDKNDHYIFDNEIQSRFQQIYKSYSVTNEKTLDTIKIFNSQYNYLADPHTATGLSVLHENNYDHPVISLACAHPAKFGNAIKKSIDIDILLPKVLENIFDKKENMHILNNNSEDIKRFILKNI